MPSMIFYYENETIRTKKLDGLFRSLAWDASEKGLILVGNSGRVVTLIGEEVRYLNSGTRQNLRAVSVNPVDAQIMIVGNAGTILRINKQGQVAKIESPATENLRAVSWDRTGTVALIAGNRGTLLRYSNERCNPVENARANLRRVSWRPGFDEALITSNCFAEEFFPSPNLHNYNLTTNSVSPLNEGRSDLIGVDWHPKGSAALIVGYDVIWHNGFIGTYEGRNLSPLQFENRRVYPVDVKWKPSGNGAAIVTATTQPGVGRGTVYLYDGSGPRSIFADDDFFFSAVAWNQETKCLAALASPATRTFNC